MRKFCFTAAHNHHPAQGAEAAEHTLPSAEERFAAGPDAVNVGVDTGADSNCVCDIM